MQSYEDPTRIPGSSRLEELHENYNISLAIPTTLFIIHCAGISATGWNMLRCGKRTISQCPQCHADDEHGEHIVLCASKSAHDTFLTAFAELGLWLQKQQASRLKQPLLILFGHIEMNWNSTRMNMKILRLHMP